jgi:alkanesulfonate monooxygenase
VAERGELHDRCLWTPLAREFQGQGSTTALVGSYETVAAALVDYAEIGCDLLSIRGWDVWEDAQDYGRHVLPLVRQELAHRAATGRAPVLNPDSKPAAAAVPAVA